MRLVTRQIHRAFPELDRFSDEQCGRFVKAARGGWVARIVRAAILGALALGAVCIAPSLLLAILTTFAAALTPASWGSEDRAMAGSFMLAVMLVLSPLIALVFRDILLRVRIRQILRAHSACERCEYRLLGLPLDEHNVVVCPECGTRTRVDPSLGALVAGEANLSRRSVGEDLVKPWIMSTSGWRLTRRLGVFAFVLFVALPIFVFGCWEYFIQKQATAARATFGTFVEAESLAKSFLSFDPPGESLRINEFDKRFRERCNTIDPALFDEMVTLPSGTSQKAYSRWRTPWRPRPTPPTDPDAIALDQANRRLEAAWLAAATSAGIPDLISELVRSPRLEFAVPHDVSMQGVASFGAWSIPEAFTLTFARLSIASENRDDTELVSAAEDIFAVARGVRVQSGMMDLSTSRMMQTRSLDSILLALRERPSTPFAEAVGAMLARQWRDIPPKLELERSRLLMRDHVAAFFSDPSAARFGGASAGFRKNYAGMYPGGKVPIWVGTLEDNLGDIDTLFKVAATRQSFEPFERDSKSGTSFDPLTMHPIARMAAGWMLSGTWAVATVSGESPQDRLELRRRFITVAAALARHHAVAGTYPSTLAELGPLLPTVPLDPWSGKPLLYRAEGGTYVLYSVGFDGVDNGGVSTPPPNGQPVAGLDIVAGQE